MKYTVTWYNISKWIERIDWKLYQNVSKKFHVAKQRRTDIYEEKSACRTHQEGEEMADYRMER